MATEISAKDLNGLHGDDGDSITSRYTGNVSTIAYDVNTGKQGSGASECTLEGVWMWRVIFEVGLSMPVEFGGVIGNLVAFFVLWKQKPTTTTTVLLQFLAVADTCVLILITLSGSLRILHVCFIPGGPYMNGYPQLFVYGYPFIFITRFCTTWFTVLLTVDRFIAVARPLHAQRLCTISRIYKEVVILLIVGIIFNIPRFLEHRLAPDNPYGFKATDLVKENKAYTIAYRIITFFLVMYVIPITLLAGLNIILIRTLRKARLSRGLLRSHASETSNKRDATVVVAIVVIVFIVCNIPAMIAHLFWSLHLHFESMKVLEEPRRYLAIVSNFLVAVNSAINFVIYCVFSRNFRRTTERMCIQRRGSGRLIRETTHTNGSTGPTGGSVNIHMNPLYSRYG